MHENALYAYCRTLSRKAAEKFAILRQKVVITIFGVPSSCSRQVGDMHAVEYLFGGGPFKGWESRPLL